MQSSTERATSELSEKSDRAFRGEARPCSHPASQQPGCFMGAQSAAAALPAGNLGTGWEESSRVCRKGAGCAAVTLPASNLIA